MSTLRLISNEVKLAFGLLSPIDRTKLAWLSILQVLVSILDLLAIFFLGVITSSTLVSIQGSSPMIPWQITTALEALGFNNASFNQMIAFLGIVTSTLLVLRSITSAVLARKIFIFLSSRSATASSKLFEDILSAGYPLFFNSSPSEIQYTVIRSVNALFLGIVGSTAILLTEALIIFLMFIGLASFDLTLAAITLLYFSTISILLSSKFGGRIQRHNQELSKNYIKNESKVIEIVSLYREISLRGSIQYFVDNFALVRMRSAKILARTQFIPLIIKYWMEISFIVGALLISGVQFLQYSATEAISSLVIFLGASGRISPALLRLQTSYLTIRSSLGSGSLAIRYRRELFNYSSVSHKSKESCYVTKDKKSFESIELKNVTFTFGDSFSLQGISLKIARGNHVAIVGPSGSGKTTLLNLMLGALTPTSGVIEIDGINVVDFMQNSPGIAGFVSQDPIFFDDTIRNNLLLGLDSFVIADEFIWKALDMAQLKEFVDALPLKLETKVGYRGSNFSAGQRQRLSLARALITEPSILFLDEVSSSLDTITERAISQTLKSKNRKTTIIQIAHRLSTITDVDNLIYLESGKIIAQGTFSEVRKQVPSFNTASSFSGL